MNFIIETFSKVESYRAKMTFVKTLKKGGGRIDPGSTVYVEASSLG